MGAQIASDFDVAIVGAGPVGALSALLAAQSGMRVLLLDAAAQKSSGMPSGEFDLRVVALAPGSQALFESVGAWPDELLSRAQPYEAMQVWDAAGRAEHGRIAFSAAGLGLSALGHIVEVPALQWALDEAIHGNKSRGSITRWQSASFATLTMQANAVEVHCEDGRCARAAVLVGADGRDSRVRKRSGIGVEFRDYVQQGVVAVLDPEQAHEAVARQAFTAHGPLGLLPMANGQISIVWSVPDAYALTLLAMDEATFCRSLAQACGQSGFRLVSRRVAFPLILQHALDYVTDGVALVGDAAHVVHPLAGLGMNLGFEDAAALFGGIEMPEDSQGQPLAISRLMEARLRHYGRVRRRAVLPAIAVIDALDSLFSSRSGELASLRDWGLNLVDGQERLKREFMRYALGHVAQ